MTANEFIIPSHVKKKLKELGYTVDEQMTGLIKQWWNWYTCTDSWYKVPYVAPEHKGSRDRLSIHPARKVVKEWASLILTDTTEISCDNEASNIWLSDYLAESQFLANMQSLVEKSFALGTGAMALWFDVEEETTTIKIRKYDARMVVPLTWDDDGCTECAFVSRVYFRGKPSDQLQIHCIGEKGYEITTYVWTDGKPQNPEGGGFLDTFETECPTPTFALVRPGIENTYVDNSAYGVSVFSDAIDAIKGVDLTFDAIFQEIELTEPMVFADESLIDYRGKNKGIAIPKLAKSRLFRKLMGTSSKDMIEIYSPSIRIDPLKEAFNVALAEFGDQTGFGTNYFTLDKNGGLKTATEVVSDNSTLMRNVRKHENSIAGSIKTIITSLLTCARNHSHAGIADDFGTISVQFDDSVIVDTQTEKNAMLAEIAAGVIPSWKFAERFYGMSEEEAREWVSDREVIDVGF